MPAVETAPAYYERLLNTQETQESEIEQLQERLAGEQELHEAAHERLRDYLSDLDGD